MNRQIGIWMYQNNGGENIEKQIVSKLKDREIESITGLNLGKAVVSNGNIKCDDKGNCTYSLSKDIDLLFSYNAGETSKYQTYLYQALNKIIPMINNYDSYCLSEDKFQTSFILKNNGIDTAEYEMCYKDHEKHIEYRIDKWPKMICKPTNGWGGTGLKKIDNNKYNLYNLINHIDKINLKNIYIEKFIDYDNTDYRIDIVDGKFVSCYGRKAKEGEWKTNISSGGSIFLREPNQEIIDLAINATKITGLEIAGVDIIYDREKEKYIILEVNGIPAFATPEQEKNGLSFNNKKIDLIVDLIDKKTSCIY